MTKKRISYIYTGVALLMAKLLAKNFERMKNLAPLTEVWLWKEAPYNRVKPKSMRFDHAIRFSIY